MRAGDRELLPNGVTYKASYHHSSPEPTRDSLLLRALAETLEPMLADKRGADVDGVPRIGRATRKKAEALAAAVLETVRRVEA